jgi:hypothetical protein
MSFKVCSQSGINEPNMIPGLLLWIDASEAGTLSRCGTEAKKVFDKSAGGHCFAVKDNHSKPKILQSRFKGKTILRFERSSQPLIGSWNFSSVDTLFVIGVINGEIIEDPSYIDIQDNVITIPSITKLEVIEMGELLIYNARVITQFNVDWIEEYLTDKWKLA